MAVSKRRGFLGLLTGAWAAASLPMWRYVRNRRLEPVAAGYDRWGKDSRADEVGRRYFAGELAITREEFERACLPGASEDVAAVLDRKWRSLRVLMLDRLDEGWERPKEG